MVDITILPIFGGPTLHNRTGTQKRDIGATTDGNATGVSRVVLADRRARHLFVSPLVLGHTDLHPVRFCGL